MAPNSVSKVTTAAQDAALFYVYFAHSRVRTIPAITSILDTEYSVVAPSVNLIWQCTASTASTSHCLAVANSD